MMPREAFESELRFLGLLIMENRLKERTTSVIKELNDCNVKTVMATGDNILTAVSVARQCHIANKSIEAWIGELMTDISTKKVVWRSSIDTSLEKQFELPFVEPVDLALTGEAFEHIIENEEPRMLNTIVAKAKVFARMSPDQKA